MRLHCVRVIAGLPLRQERTIHLPWPARPVDPRLQQLLVCSLLGDTKRLARGVIRQQHPRPRQVQRVRRHAIRIEQPPELLRRHPWAEILVVELVNVGGHRDPWVLGRAGTVDHMADEVAVVGVRIVGGGVRLRRRVTLVRPP